MDTKEVAIRDLRRFPSFYSLAKYSRVENLRISDYMHDAFSEVLPYIEVSIFPVFMFIHNENISIDILH